MVYARRDFPTRFLKLGKKLILKLVSHTAVADQVMGRGLPNWAPCLATIDQSHVLTNGGGGITSLGYLNAASSSLWGI